MSGTSSRHADIVACPSRIRHRMRCGTVRPPLIGSLVGAHSRTCKNAVAGDPRDRSLGTSRLGASSSVSAPTRRRSGWRLKTPVPASSPGSWLADQSIPRRYASPVCSTTMHYGSMGGSDYSSSLSRLVPGCRSTGSRLRSSLLFEVWPAREPLRTRAAGLRWIT